MEFLMTYGWALLVVLVAIGALAFFGVLNPGQFLPDQCLFFSGFSCLNPYATATTPATLSFSVQNGLGYPMNSLTIDVTPAGGSALTGGTDDCTVVSTALVDGNTRDCSYLLGTVSSGTRLKATADIEWYDEADNLRSRSSQLAITIE